jgi:SAM-dependent methyltransferase
VAALALGSQGDTVAAVALGSQGDTVAAVSLGSQGDTVAAVSRNVRLRELLIGVEGLALLRHLYDGTDKASACRLHEVRRVLAEDAYDASEPIHEALPRTGYEAWSPSYDEPGNPIVALEQPAVWSLFDGIAPGRALDAACGTGRHAGRLVALGHTVTAVDLTPAMLARAAVNVPQARLHQGDLLALPVPDAQFDLVVCGLALSHLSDLGAGVAELARSLRPGGALVISVLHPFLAYLGWQAPFTDPAGGRGFVREHAHGHAAYLAAFRAADLAVRDCLEPSLGPAQVRTKRRAFLHVPEAVSEAYLGLPAVLVWSAAKAR